MALGALFPGFLVIIGAPMFAGRTLEESGDFNEAVDVIATMPELVGLTGNALIQAFLFHQFALLLLMVPVVSATALATHAVIGEKQSKALEPLLATPISTVELLAAKALTPFLFALALTWGTAALYILGILLLGEPGVWQTALGPRTSALLLLSEPLLKHATLLLSVFFSPAATVPRSAQQLTSLLKIGRASCREG